MAEWTEDGKLIPDNTPVEVPLHLKQGETEAMRIARAVSLEFSQQADKKGYETFEESQDFEIEDDEDIFPTSQFEVVEMQEEYLPDDPAPEEKTIEELAIEQLEEENKQKAIEDAKTKIKTEKNERQEEETD